MQVIHYSFRIILGISIVLISALSIQEIEVQPFINISDKLIHFSCFLYLTIISWLSRIFYKELFLYVIVLGYGILIEIVQIYIPYRSFEFLDIFADFLGILAGIFFINFFKDLYPKYWINFFKPYITLSPLVIWAIVIFLKQEICNEIETFTR